MTWNDWGLVYTLSGGPQKVVWYKTREHARTDAEELARRYPGTFLTLIHREASVFCHVSGPQWSDEVPG